MGLKASTRIEAASTAAFPPHCAADEGTDSVSAVLLASREVPRLTAVPIPVRGPQGPGGVTRRRASSPLLSRSTSASAARRKVASRWACSSAARRRAASRSRAARISAGVGR